MRFDLLDKRVVVCSNAGATRTRVAEFAVGLMLAAGKSIVKFDRVLRAGPLRTRGSTSSGARSHSSGEDPRIVGYGGIGRSTARLVKPFGMRVMASGGVRSKIEGLSRFEVGLLDEAAPQVRPSLYWRFRSRR